jgi:MEMO1 family protein
MSVVRPPFATGFYPGQRVQCLRQLDAIVGEVQLPDGLPARPLGGLVPHAGWVYSGPTAALLWVALARAAEPPEVVVLLGAVHRRGVRRATVYSGDAWATPDGDVPVDRQLADAIVAGGGAVIGAGIAEHDDEHSIEVQVPFVRRLMPEVGVVPIAVPADARAVDAGRLVAETVRQDGRRIVLVASSDLTHYGARYGFAPVGAGREALGWSRANDRRLLDRALDFDAPGVLEEAATRHSACGAGALAACITAMRELGATEAELLGQTTSWEVRPVGPPDMFVGYASIVFG